VTLGLLGKICVSYSGIDEFRRDFRSSKIPTEAHIRVTVVLKKERLRDWQDIEIRL